jgi:propanol-preferring alcohol dehydrogenase
MRAARFLGPGRPVVVAEVPVPEPGPGQARVAVRACGVCGSDLHIVEGTTPTGKLPITLGHEASGVVDRLGPDTDGPGAGTRVSIAAGYGCGTCPFCRAALENLCPASAIPGITEDGSQADYVVVPVRALLPLPARIDHPTAAVLTDAVATPFRAIGRSGLEPGGTAAVYGLGGLGVAAVVLLRQLWGATVIGVDPAEPARSRATRFGAGTVVDGRDAPARQIRELTGGGVDAAFEFVGRASAVDQAVKSLHPGGTATVVGVGPGRLGLGLRQETLVSGELRVQGSFGSTHADLARLIELVGSGLLDLTGLISHRFPLSAAPEAFRVLAERDGDPLRVVVEPG